MKHSKRQQKKFWKKHKMAAGAVGGGAAAAAEEKKKKEILTNLPTIFTNPNTKCEVIPYRLKEDGFYVSVSTYKALYTEFSTEHLKDFLDRCLNGNVENIVEDTYHKELRIYYTGTMNVSMSEKRQKRLNFPKYLIFLFLLSIVLSTLSLNIILN